MNDVQLYGTIKAALESGELGHYATAAASELCFTLEDIIRDHAQAEAAKREELQKIPSAGGELAAAAGIAPPAGHLGGDYGMGVADDPRVIEEQRARNAAASAAVEAMQRTPAVHVGVTENPPGNFNVTPKAPGQENVAATLKQALDWMAGKPVAGEVAPALMQYALKVDQLQRERDAAIAELARLQHEAGR